MTMDIWKDIHDWLHNLFSWLIYTSLWLLVLLCYCVTGKKLPTEFNKEKICDLSFYFINLYHKHLSGEISQHNIIMSKIINTF